MAVVQFIFFAANLGVEVQMSSVILLSPQKPAFGLSLTSAKKSLCRGEKSPPRGF
jgi:hypothetical protein